MLANLMKKREVAPWARWGARPRSQIAYSISTTPVGQRLNSYCLRCFGVAGSGALMVCQVLHAIFQMALKMLARGSVRSITTGCWSRD